MPHEDAIRGAAEEIGRLLEDRFISFRQLSGNGRKICRLYELGQCPPEKNVGDKEMK